MKKEDSQIFQRSGSLGISKKANNDLPNLSSIAVAMVDPEFAINVGYVARVMANFGLSKFYVVSKKRRPVFNLDQAAMFASHGHSLIDGIRIIKSLSALRRNFRILAGTTAIQGKRKSNITRKTMDLEKFAALSAKSILSTQQKKISSTAKGNMCLVFGRDTTGLTNEELRVCDYTITIGTGTDYKTLNISHAAAIILYSLRRSLLRETYEDRGSCKSDSGKSSSPIERQRLIKLFQELAREADFQIHKQSKLTETINRMLNRSEPSLKEIYFLMGLVSKARSKIKVLSQNHAR